MVLEQKFSTINLPLIVSHNKCSTKYSMQWLPLYAKKERYFLKGPFALYLQVAGSE